MTAVFAADKAVALEPGKELFPGHPVTLVPKEGEPGSDTLFEFLLTTIILVLLSSEFWRLE